MPGSVVSLHVGQCGNQIGTEFWKTLCQEHGIGLDGVLLQPNKPGEDKKDIFFNELNCGTRFMPRSVLVDLEPRVINLVKTSDCRQLHNHGNMYVWTEGRGAGNNWAHGYNQSAERLEDIFEIITRETENADSLEGFSLSHSISGGTGSGLGSKIMEQVKDRFPKSILQTSSVFANANDETDVVVSPYNSMLTLDWLVEYPDFVIVLENAALYRVATETMRVQKPSVEHINSMVSRIMTSVSAPMRFYSPVYTKLLHIAACVNPFPPMQFVQTAYAPFIPADNKIMEPKSLISSAASMSSKSSAALGSPSQKEVHHCMLSALAVLQVDSAHQGSDVTAGGIRRQAQKNSIRYPPWSSTALSIASCKLSPYMEHKCQASGLLLANHTNTAIVFRQMVKQFDQLYKKKAFLDQFVKEGVMQTMIEAREKIVNVVKLYEEATTMEFISDAAGLSELSNISFNSTSNNDDSPMRSNA
uniref:Tubulin gamma chain n=1 Tax=Ditylenchus dipsaci TaxID=166011 RepID=A0A915EL61_9BILA